MTTYPWRRGLARCATRCDVDRTHTIPAGAPIVTVDAHFIACRRCAVALTTINRSLERTPR